MLDQRPDDYNPPSQEVLSGIKANVSVLIEMGRQLGVALELDSDSIMWLDGYINSKRNSFDDEMINMSVNVIGSFVGEAIIANFGGEWIQSEDGLVGVRLNDRLTAFPLAKVEKQIREGEAESVYGFYAAIPALTDSDLLKDE